MELESQVRTLSKAPSNLVAQVVSAMTPTEPEMSAGHSRITSFNLQSQEQKMTPEVPQNEQELADWGNEDEDPLAFLNQGTPKASEDEQPFLEVFKPVN